jgi:hypothetical protein
MTEELKFKYSDPEERITQLEWEIEKLTGLKNVEGVGKEELMKLRQPTRPEEIEWRIQSSWSYNGSITARIIPYVNARAVADRFDTCIGPHRWMDSYREIEGGFLCTLSVFTRNGWIQKEDAADRSHIEGIKGGVSGALKRAAVKWGFGRDLYTYGSEYAEISATEKPGFEWAETKDKKEFYWRKK